MTPAQLRACYGPLDAYAGARLVTLGDGGERGVRVIELRSGGGLDLEVVVDRGFDLGRLAIDGRTVSWHAAHGLRAPWLNDAHAGRGQGFLRANSGFLVTGGYDHIRQPETDRLDASPLHPHADVDYPLHGDGTGQPARLIGYGLEEEADAPYLWAEGEVIQSMTFRGALRFRRRLEMPLGGTGFTLTDRVTNIGPTAMTHMLLYHFNLGYPLVAEGTVLDAGDARVSWQGAPHDPLAAFAAPRVALNADLSIFTQPAGRLPSATVTSPDGLALTLGVDPAQLPFLQVLRMEGQGLYGMALEPCTTGTRSRADARARGQMIVLQPGDHRDYRLEISLAASSRPGA